MKKRPLPVEPSDMSDIAITIDERVKSRANLLKSRQTEGTLEIGMQQLEAGWALAGRTSASTLADWMKRLSAALISQSPSPIIRSCQQLVKHHWLNIYSMLLLFAYGMNFSHQTRMKSSMI
jgi:hypothetical protein